MNNLNFVRYCPHCGAENPRQAAFCVKDGEDISMVAVEPRRGQEAPPAPARAPASDAAAACAPTAPTGRDEVILELVSDPRLRFAVGNGQVVGRTADADVQLQRTPKADYVSSRMARFWRRGKRWYVQHVGDTNFIKVDGEKYSGDEEIPLEGGALVALPLDVFRVVLPGGGAP
jgi:hypothetical protein